MPARTVAPAAGSALDSGSIGRTVREAEAALCRIRAAAGVMLPKHLERRAAAPLHELGLARAASVGLVDDSEAFYPAAASPRDGPECVVAPWLPEHPGAATPEHWARLDADVEAADKLLRRLVGAFYCHYHASERWAEVSRALDEFWGGALAARVTLMADVVRADGERGQWAAVTPKRRPTSAGRGPKLGRGPLVALDVA